MDAMPGIVPVPPFWKSWLGRSVTILDEEQLANIVRTVVTVITAVCTVVVQVSLGQATCSCEATHGPESADRQAGQQGTRVATSPAKRNAKRSVYIKPRFRCLFRAGQRRYMRRVSASNRQLQMIVQQERRALVKFNKYVRAKRAKNESTQSSLEDTELISGAFQAQQNRLMQENANLTKKIATMTKRVSMWTEIQRLQSLQKTALKRNAKESRQLTPAWPKSNMAKRPSWH